MKRAIKYIMENINGAELESTIDEMFLYRIPFSVANPSLSCTIQDLLDEYAEDNNLQEGWYGDSIEDFIDEILRKED